jgi:hypothetical protein
MMALSANAEIPHFPDQELRTVPVAASKHVYKGGLVGLAATGYGQPLVAGDPFAGLAYEEMDNSSGSNGDLAVRVYTVGDFEFTLSGAVIADVGRPVFASADNTLTFVGFGNTYVGVVRDFIATNKIMLRIDPDRRLVKTVTHAVEDLAANADIAARAIHNFNAEGWIAAARVVNQASAAAGIDAGNTCTVTLAIDAGTVVTEVFDNVTTFPAANAAKTLGTLANTHAVAGDVLTSRSPTEPPPPRARSWSKSITCNPPARGIARTNGASHGNQKHRFKSRRRAVELLSGLRRRRRNGAVQRADDSARIEQGQRKLQVPRGDSTDARVGHGPKGRRRPHGILLGR